MGVPPFNPARNERCTQGGIALRYTKHHFPNEGSAVSKPATPTLAYYATHASDFAESTANVEFSTTQNRFATLLPPGAHILDFGCGSGRDTKHFLDAGLEVTATDGSPELCAIASERSGIPVRCELFSDLADVDAYDGIWACSSILHLPKPELENVLRKMVRALKPSGIIYTSFKHGTFEGMRNGRHFTDFDEPTLREFLVGLPELRILELWVTGDVRPGREAERWLNVLLRRT